MAKGRSPSAEGHSVTNGSYTETAVRPTTSQQTLLSHPPLHLNASEKSAVVSSTPVFTASDESLEGHSDKHCSDTVAVVPLTTSQRAIPPPHPLQLYVSQWAVGSLPPALSTESVVPPTSQVNLTKEPSTSQAKSTFVRSSDQGKSTSWEDECSRLRRKIRKLEERMNEIENKNANNSANNSELDLVSHLNADDSCEVVAILAKHIFSLEELKNCSITGKKTIKCQTSPRPALDPAKFQKLERLVLTKLEIPKTEFLKKFENLQKVLRRK